MKTRTLLILILVLLAGSASAAEIHSRPGATHTLSLNFDGDAGYAQPAWGTEADHATVVSAVAAYFAGWDVDVTTAQRDPVPNRVARITIGGGAGVPYGGVAHTGSYATVGVASVFSDNLGSDLRIIALATAHEAGHVYGLYHQSVWVDGSRVEEYNAGTRERAPIMGLAYYSDSPEWWVGINYRGELQDDRAVLTKTLGLATPEPSLVGLAVLPLACRRRRHRRDQRRW